MRRGQPPHRIRYASVWEDAEVLCRALGPVAPGGRLLSIASAGDNALSLLTLDPAEVIALDYNPAQIACLDLRIAAFRMLGYEELLAFLGVTASDGRLDTYGRLRVQLPNPSVGFWDAHADAIRRGVMHAGRFERYFQLFRRLVLPLVHSPTTIDALLQPRDPAARDRFYVERWDTPRWRGLFRIFFSRRVMAWLGRDPAYFAHLDEPLSNSLLARTRTALTALPADRNPYLAYIVRGNFPRECLPHYLQPEHHSAIRDRLDRLRPVTGSLLEVLKVEPGTFEGFNLSDVFEYLPPAEHEKLYGALLRRALAGSRLVYWNMQVPRSLPEAWQGEVRTMDALARDLHAQDRAWFYRALHIDEVVRPVATSAQESAT